jgi:uncharacterized damage-inducible protein DinB
MAALQQGKNNMIAFLTTVPEEKLDYRYAEGKWTIKEIIMHLMDAERIFAYRTLRFSRNDQNILLGFDDEEYVTYSNASERSRQSLIDEYTAQRQSTIELYRNMTPEMCNRGGVASGNEMSVTALGYIICGHEIHHLQVIKERYL